MYGYNAGPPMAIPIYTVLPYCVIELHVHYTTLAHMYMYMYICMYLYCIQHIRTLVGTPSCRPMHSTRVFWSLKEARETKMVS